MKIEKIDHIVMTVRDIATTCEFYLRTLGMDVVIFDEGRKALSFGSQKINLHETEKEYQPKAHMSMPGAIDLCLITNTPIVDVARHLKTVDVEILKGPIKRTGATGPIISVYFRDPDQNLIEVSNCL